MNFSTLGIGIILTIHTSLCCAVTWEEQAERLQLISASLMENLPVSAPVASAGRVGLENRISFLPELNPQIGSKHEKVPSAPIHAIPTLSLEGYSMRCFAGYLVPGLEGLMGLNAKLTQSTIGLEWVPDWDGIYTSLGAQRTTGTLVGAITASDANDEFSLTSTEFHAALGFHGGPWFGNILLAKKSTESRFSIPADATEVTLNDELSGSSPPLATQAMLGLEFWGVQRVAFGILHQDKRLTMPRLVLDFGMGF